MRLLDLTLDTPQENLALDEALIEEAEAGRLDEDVLRLWETDRPTVVVGRSSRVQQEVDLVYCQAHDISVVRRCSGGAAVVIGPGCLLYSVMLSYRRWPQLRMVDAAHQFVLAKLSAATQHFHPQALMLGTSDLTLDGMKCSGNSLRCKRDHLLYHGTLLCRFELDLISKCLQMPPRQPKYRAGREHHAFVTNLDCSPAAARRALIEQWQPAGALTSWPEKAVKQLVEARYSRREWNHRY